MRGALGKDVGEYRKRKVGNAHRIIVRPWKYTLV
jgi:hypothetical protein